jgi:hypothetical protein
MTFNATQLAGDLLSAASNAGGILEARLDIRRWPAGMVRETIDAVLNRAELYKLRLRGIRTDAEGFAQFGIQADTINSGRYRDIPIVMSPTAPFDTMELVFEQLEPEISN